MKPYKLPWVHYPLFRRLLLLALGLLLFSMGQFEEPIFAGLAQGWQAVFTGLGYPQWGAATHTGLSTHSLPVALSYRLLYVSLNLAIVYLLLGGRQTLRLASWCNAGALVMGTLLVGAGRGLQLPLVSRQGHLLIDLVCSPLFFLLVWALLRLTRPAPNASADAGEELLLTGHSLSEQEVTPAATSAA